MSALELDITQISDILPLFDTRLATLQDNIYKSL